MSKKIPVELTCPICGKTGIFNPTTVKKMKTCGQRECSREWRRRKFVGNKLRLGIPAWNKGKTGLPFYYRPPKGIHFSPATEFKKGMKNYNHLPVGSVTIRTDKNGTKRRWIKTAEPNRWREYARQLWLKAGGRSQPKPLLLHHQNGNALDDRMENLMLVTRSEHLKIHRPQWEKKRLAGLRRAAKERWMKWRMEHPRKAAKLARKRLAPVEERGVLI